MAKDNFSWEREWQAERDEAPCEGSAQEERVPYNRNTWGEPRGRRKVYIVQTCHWEYDDALYDWEPYRGASLLAFTTLERARAYLRQQQRLRTDVTLGIMEVYIDTDLDEDA
jgi:hypothetical protein